MSGRYERVNAHDDEDVRTSPRATPASPPPSFHSRSSSPLRNERQRHVDATLADAFGGDDLSDDDEADDTQRLVRPSSTPDDERTATHDVTRASSTPSPSHSHSHPHSPSPPTVPSTNRAPAGSRFRALGGGLGTDGVFANMSARPERTTETAEKEEMPPTYEQAAADAAPPYWETTILAPGLGGYDEVYVDGMPVGSLFSFVWNAMISTSFQLVGFLLTYLLHSTHAAKNGSRAGLGVTLIQYGFYMKSSPDMDAPKMSGPDGYAAPPDPNSHSFDVGDVKDGGGGMGAISGNDWMAYVLMVVGWFILIKSVADFLRARRHEQYVLQSPERGLNVPIVAETEGVERVV